MVTMHLYQVNESAPEAVVRRSQGFFLSLNLHVCCVCEGVSLAERLRRFLELMLASPDHLVDVRRLMAGTESSTDRMDDITGVLEDIRLIEKQSAHRFKWM